MIFQSRPRQLLLVFLLTTALGILLVLPLFANAQAPSLVFTAAGDYGGSANTNAVLDGIANAGATFHLALGDLSYGSYLPETAWCDYVKSHVGASLPFELGAGNHDMDGSSQGHINNFAKCLPDRLGTLNGTYGKQYYFDYQNLARVIFISPNLQLDGELYTYTAGSARYNWLANTIDGARRANLPWVILAMHKNCISAGTKSCEIGADLLNLLAAKKVDLVLQGHDHSYQRSKQLAHSSSCAAIPADRYNAACVSDDGADNAYAMGKGMVLAIVGTGGRSIYPSNPSNGIADYFAKYVAPGDTPRYGFLKLTITATELAAQFVPVTAGTFTDAFTIRSTAAPPPTRAWTPSATRTSTAVALTATPTHSSACARRPAAPVLVKPVANAVVYTTRPKLRWRAADCAAMYRVVVRDAATGKGVDGQGHLTQLRYRTDPLPKNRQLKWFVRACNPPFGCARSEMRYLMVH